MRNLSIYCISNLFELIYVKAQEEQFTAQLDDDDEDEGQGFTLMM